MGSEVVKNGLNTTEEAPGDRTGSQCQGDTSGVIDVEDRGDTYDNSEKSDAVDVCRIDEKHDIGTSETCHVKDSNDDNDINSNSKKTVSSINSLDAVTNGVTVTQMTLNGDCTQSAVQPSDVVVEPEDGGDDVPSDTTADVICHTASSRSTGDDVKQKDTDITENNDTVMGREKCDVVTVTGKDSDLTEQCDTRLETEKDTDITEKDDGVTDKVDTVVMTGKDTSKTKTETNIHNDDTVVMTKKETDLTDKETNDTEKSDTVMVTENEADIIEKGDTVVVTDKDTDITEKGDTVVVTDKDSDITEKCDAVVVTENDTDTARNHDMAGDKAENKLETKVTQIVPDISVSMATEPTDTVVVTVTPDVSDTADVSSASAKLTSPLVTVSDTSGHVTQLTPCHDTDIELCHLERMTAKLHLSASSSTSTPLNYRSVPVIRSDDDASLATQLDLDLFADAPESSPQVRGHGRRSLETISLKDGGYKAKACHRDGSLLG